MRHYVLDQRRLPGAFVRRWKLEADSDIWISYILIGPGIRRFAWIVPEIIERDGLRAAIAQMHDHADFMVKAPS